MQTLSSPFFATKHCNKIKSVQYKNYKPSFRDRSGTHPKNHPFCILFRDMSQSANFSSRSLHSFSSLSGSFRRYSAPRTNGAAHAFPGRARLSFLFSTHSSIHSARQRPAGRPLRWRERRTREGFRLLWHITKRYVFLVLTANARSGIIRAGEQDAFWLRLSPIPIPAKT